MNSRNDIRAEDYHAKARAASALASASSLDRVRELHEAAAVVWRELAISEERQAASLLNRYGRAAQLVGSLGSGARAASTVWS